MRTIQPASDRAYQDFLQAIKSQVVQSRIGTARAVNRSLIGLYWTLGQLIVERQEALGWGKAVVERLSADLKAEFPEMRGFSPRNLWFIKQFYEAYADAPEFLKQAVSEIPWGHNILNYAADQQMAVAFSLKSKANPVGVATYQLYPQGPEEYVGMLPTDRDWQRLLDLASSS
jgi:predicted nuclease of restriction endonuclease-like (RecB) superfamily